MGKVLPSLPSPSLLGACTTSFYPQAKASEFQSWVGGGAERRREHHPLGGGRWDGAPEEAGRGRPEFLAGESLAHLPQTLTLCTHHNFMGRSSKSQCYMSLCVSLCGCEILGLPPRVSGECLGP